MNCLKNRKKLTFEEENAVRYVSGYVIWHLLQKAKDSCIQHVLGDLKDEGYFRGTSTGVGQLYW